MTILVVFFLLILLSVQGTQKIYMKSETDTFVSKDTQVYQSYDHLYKDLFQKEYIVVVVEGNDVRTVEVTEAINRLDQQFQPVNEVEETISSASAIKQVNYKMTGRSSIPDNDKDIRAIVDGNPSIFGKLFPDNYHTRFLYSLTDPHPRTREKRLCWLRKKPSNSLIFLLHTKSLSQNFS